MRDLARLVGEKFHSPIYTFGYLGCLILLGIHLRHGIWSGLQSLGVLNKGKHTINWKQLDLENGFYFLQLQDGQQRSVSQKVLKID